MSRAPWMIGGGGLLLAMFGWWLDPLRFHAAWTAGLAIWLEWPLGSLILLLVHAMTGGRWGYAIRPALLAGIATLPLLLPAVIPLVLHMGTLYPWVHPAEAMPNGFYLNLPFFFGRGIVYLVIWFGLAALVLWWVRRRDVPPPGLAGPGLILLAITITFAAIDTTLSLRPEFNSSIWGMVSVAGSALMALAVAALLSTATADRRVLADLGKMMLGLVVLWAYLDFVQFLIVWESDLRNEAGWYLPRASGVWLGVVVVIGVGHFLLPFALLIFPAVQRSRSGISLVAGWLILMEGLRIWWVVLPAVPHGLSWIAVVVVIAFGGLAVGLGRRAPHLEAVHA